MKSLTKLAKSKLQKKMIAKKSNKYVVVKGEDIVKVPVKKSEWNSYEELCELEEAKNDVNELISSNLFMEEIH